MITFHGVGNTSRQSTISLSTSERSRSKVLYLPTYETLVLFTTTKRHRIPLHINNDCLMQFPQPMTTRNLIIPRRFFFVTEK